MSLYRSYQSGQVLLMTLLVLAVATTIGLALVGRSSTDVSISTRIEESARAFSAAEAGVEETLKSGVVVGGELSGVTYKTNILVLGGAGIYQIPSKTPRGTTATVWLTNHNSDGTLDTTSDFAGSTLDVCWSPEATTPALVVHVYYLSAGTYKVARVAVDPVSRSNYFTLVGAGHYCQQGDNVYRATIDFASLLIGASDTLLALRVTPVYSDTQLYVDPGGVDLPQQGNRVDSTGTTTGGVTRKIIAFQEYRTPPQIFDAVVVSQGSFGY